MSEEKPALAREPGSPNRREFGAMLVGTLLTMGGVASSAPRKKHKNILFLMTDQHRPAALSINGDTPARTPNLDALARSGVRFDNAYCSTPVCVPSRVSLLTGLWTHNHHVVNNDIAWPYDTRTIAHYLGDAGYISGLIGKMHFIDAQTHGFDYYLSFDDWVQYLGPKTGLFASEIGEHAAGAAGLPGYEWMWKESGDPWTGHIVDDGRKGATGLGGVSKLDEPDHFESFVTRESIRFLKKYADAEEPFFLITSYLKPHGPFDPAARFFHQFNAEDMKLPETWGKVDQAHVADEIRKSINNDWLTPELRDPENAKRRMALYYASLMQMDDNVGHMLKALRDLDLEKDTIVIYTSDHGEMLGEHGLWQKTVFYDQSAGVPLIVRAPGVTPQDKRSQTPVSLVSVVPTLLELCGVPVPTGLDGDSLVQDLRTPEKTRDTTIYSEYALRSQAAKAMVRHGDFKYTAYSHDGPDELYNVHDDPTEMRNLVLEPQFSAKAAEMRAKIKAWHEPA